MKKTVTFILIIATLLGLCACRARDDGNADTVTFYYLRRHILYGASDGVISPEERQLSGLGLEAQLAQYLSGPQSEQLYSPFPAGTRLVSVKENGNTMTIVLSGEFDALEGLRYPLACGCLAKTCFALTDTSEVTIAIEGADRTITLTPDSITLTDDSDTIDATIGTEPVSD